MINVWEQKKSRNSGKIYYKNILTNESKFGLPSHTNGTWKKLKDESNNIFLMYIPDRSMKLRGGVHFFDYDNMTLELYNQQNPDYPMVEFPPPTNSHLLEEWMNKPFRTSDQLRAFWVYQRYNRELVNDWSWTRIMRYMNERLILSYTDLINFYTTSPLNGANLSDSMHFLSQPISRILLTSLSEREQFLSVPFRSSEDLLAYWNYRNYGHVSVADWQVMMRILSARGITSYNDLDANRIIFSPNYDGLSIEEQHILYGF